MTRVTTDVDALNEMFTAGVVSIFEDVFVLAGIIAIMMEMNWKLALITFAVLPLIIYATKIFRDKVRDSYRRIRIAIARINSLTCRKRSRECWCCSFSIARSAPINKFSDINASHMEAYQRRHPGVLGLLPGRRNTVGDRGRQHHLVWRNGIIRN